MPVPEAERSTDAASCREAALRLLEHPRFRAAYDFLVLRRGESAQIDELAAWWTHLQSLGNEALAQEFAATPASAAEPTAAAPAKRKRPRRRRRKGKAATTPLAESAE